VLADLGHHEQLGLLTDFEPLSVVLDPADR
jgi:hypothetical protein